MARSKPCTICESEHRSSVEIGLTHLVPAQALAAKFKLSKWAILRHAKNHLSPVMRAAILAAEKPNDTDLEALREREGESLLSNLIAQRARLLLKGEKALELGDFKASIAAENAYAASLTLTAKLLGQLIQHHDVRHSSILLSPDYLKMRDVLFATLRNYPERNARRGGTIPYPRIGSRNGHHRGGRQAQSARAD